MQSAGNQRPVQSRNTELSGIQVGPKFKFNPDKFNRNVKQVSQPSMMDLVSSLQMI